MKKETVKEKRYNTIDELAIAKMEVAYKRLQLKQGLKEIDKILRLMKKTRKVISSMCYLELNWRKNIDYENQLKMAEERLKDLSNLYEKTILKRKLLKNEFKQAQRKLAKKQKRIKDFDKKYFPGEVSNGKR